MTNVRSIIDKKAVETPNGPIPHFLIESLPDRYNVSWSGVDYEFLFYIMRQVRALEESLDQSREI